MRLVVLGAGAVGARAARQLHMSTPQSLVVADADGGRAQQVAASLGPPAVAREWSPALLDGADVVVLAHPGGHRAHAERAIERGVSVVSVAESVEEVRALLDLDAEARERGLAIVAGAGFSPGLSCLLARHAASGLDSVEEVHVAKVGAGGPACALRRRRSLAGEAVEWRDGAWVRPSRGGRQLCWFPDPVAGRDCYRAALSEPLLLVRALPSAHRVSARVGASRRDRLAARLPVRVSPRAEGAIGAVRVEVRGRRGAGKDVRVLGALDRPALACGSVAAVAALWAAQGRLVRHGSGGLAELVGEVLPVLQELANRGVRAAVFEGTGSPAGARPF